MSNTDVLNEDRIILTASEWLEADFTDFQDPIIGRRDWPVVRPLTKNLIQGQEKSFKTTFSMTLALAIAYGDQVFPQLPIPRPRKTLYTHAELSPPEIQDRTVAAITERFSDAGDILDNFISGRDFNVNLCNPAGQAELEDLVEAHRPEVLFMDPWQQLIVGYDENLAKDVGPALKFLDGLIAQYELTIFLDVHTGKDKSRGARGTSLLAGWRDNLFGVDRSGETDLVTVSVKPRSVANLEPFKLKFRNWTMCPSEGYPPQVQKIVDFVKANDGRATREQLRQHLDLDSQAMRKALERARHEKAVEDAENGDVILRRGKRVSLKPTDAVPVESKKSKKSKKTKAEAA